MLSEMVFKIDGVSPLLMHSSKGVDPLAPELKARATYTAKRKKTDDDYIMIKKIDWMLALYCNDAGPYLPGENLQRSVIEAARKKKLGKTFEQGFFIFEPELALEYEGPRKPNELFDAGFVDYRPVVVNRSRIMRCRPRFNQWSITFTISYFPDVINASDIKESIITAGKLIGVCDNRPKFGRFNVVSSAEA